MKLLAKQDIDTLHKAGIKDINSVVAAAAAFLRSYPIYASPPVSNVLSEQEKTFLEQGGAVGVGKDNLKYTTKNVITIAGEFAQMVSTAFTQGETASILGVSASRVRQRIGNGTLYVIRSDNRRVCPRFQFNNNKTLPGIEPVLSSISQNAHPVAVQRFFLSISPDLESSELGTTLSPRDWLMTGHSPDPVILIAQEL